MYALIRIHYQEMAIDNCLRFMVIPTEACVADRREQEATHTSITPIAEPVSPVPSTDRQASRPRKHVTRLFDLRILNHESQRQVAAAVGVAAPTYGAWERGDRELRAEYVVALARHFHVSPNEILDFGERAIEIPRLDSKLETLIQLYRQASPQMQHMAVEALEYGQKARRPR